MGLIVISILLYILEIAKYIIGHKLFFDGKIKGIKSIILSGIIYSAINIFGNFPYENGYLISYAAAGISVYFIFTGNWKERIFRILSIFAINICVDDIVEDVIGIILSFSLDNVIFNEAGDIIVSLITIALFFLIILIKYKYRLLDSRNNLFEIKKSIITMCILIIISIIISPWLHIEEYDIDNKIQLFYSIISVFNNGCIIIVIIYILSMKSVNERMEKLIETERALKQMSENYYSALLQKEEETRKYRHDMNNHILCLKEYAKKEKASDTLQYIGILQEKLDEIQKIVYFTGNDVLDILLNYHLQSLDNTDVTVTGMCKSKLKINDTDFCIVISNLLQNAVEEILRLENKDKYIKVDVEQGKSFFRLEIRNSSKADFAKNKRFPKTQKEDKENHGIGLMNIMETIEHNQGKFEIEGNGKEVCATVILPVEMTV